MRKIYRIIEIQSDGVIVQNEEGRVGKSSKMKLPKHAKQGDFIQHCEHGFYDVIDKEGNLIYPSQDSSRNKK